MRPRRHVVAWLALFFAGTTAAAGGPAPNLLEVAVDGTVTQPGIQHLANGSRFADAVIRAMPRRDTYELGASVFRISARTEQTRLRAALLHDLKSISAEPNEVPAVAGRAADLYAWVEKLPVTGRLPIEGNPRRLEVASGQVNQTLAFGDRFSFPERPSTITVVGAVDRPCALQHVGARDALDYMAACPIDADVADRDWLYVVQPDGRAYRLGVAMWNRGGPQALAPGAILYVPMRSKIMTRIAPELNDDMAAFLATQPLPHDHLVAP